MIRNGAEIRATFLREYSYLFSKDELETIKHRWKANFEDVRCPERDKCIYFNFTEIELGRSGTEYLLGLYGGEQVNMCFEPDEPIGQKLEAIGEPLIVRCSLDPANLEIFTDLPWGKILVSSFHILINPKAYPLDQDAYQTVAVEPKDIIEIRTLKSTISENTIL